MILTRSIGRGVLLGVVLLAGGLARGQDPREKVWLVCPIDQTRFTSLVLIGGGSISATDPELRSTRGEDLLLGNTAYCPTCGFATTYERFAKTEDLDVAKVKKALAELLPKTPPLFRALDAAVCSERNWSNDLAKVAHLTMASKWLAETTGEPDAIRQRTVQAIAAYQAVLNGPSELGEDQRILLTYLVGELYRQTGDLPEAIKWFEQANRVGQGQYEFLIKGQLFLAANAGQPVERLIESARGATPGEKIAAVKLLGDSTDARAVAFLKDLCTTAFVEKQLKGQPMLALFGDGPKAAHLPIYRAGLESDDEVFANVSARALGLLKDGPSAPALVAATLRRWKKLNPEPPEFLDPYVAYQLSAMTEALAAVATEKDLDDIARLADEKMFPPAPVLKAAAATRSAKAVPLILKLLGKDPGPVAADSAPLLAALGPELLDKLPDLKTAAGDDPLAVLKVRILACVGSAEAKEQLVAAFERADPLKLEAAIALAAKGDGRGKDLIVANFLQYRGSEQVAGFFPAPVEVVLPLLKPADYEPLFKQWEAVIDAVQKVHFRKANCRPEYGPFTLPSEPEAMAWLAVLGATRSSEARQLLLEHFDNVHGLRHFAVEGLCWFYPADKELTALLVKSLPTLPPAGQVPLIRAIGQAKDAARVPLLLDLVGSPTAIPVKLAWIEAMGRLAPDKAAPVLKQWAQSPNAQLAVEAQRALTPTAAK